MDRVRYSIGQLAQRTGLTVKAVRFYSDRGIVPPTGRSPAGYRIYSIDAIARLDLVRTLRELGLDLPTIRKVVDREMPLSAVAAAHAKALAVQIRALRLRHAVLTAVARRGATPEEIDLMHKLARLSEDERRRLVDDFLDTTLGGGLTNDDATAIRRSMTPELPDDPEAEQVAAWVEWAELTLDPNFRASMRRIAEQHAAERTQPGITGLRRDLGAVVRDQVGPALATGVDPASPEADRVVTAVTAHYARTFDIPDDVDVRRRLLTWLETANDRRRERYFRLLSVINGWRAPDSLAPTFDWLNQALHARTPA